MEKVYIINTGGTIGMVNSEEDNPLSPLVPGTWEQMTKSQPLLKELDFDTELYTFDPLIDSSDMNYENWVDISKVIERNYDKYSGFVILHGTDTLTYSATALSFMLNFLAKPVILTGSQLPMIKPRSDAVQNLITALYFAAPKTMDLPIIPEVCIFFQDKLLRGNRSRKMSASGYHGFNSPNYPPLATVGEHIEVNEKIIRPMPNIAGNEKFYINTHWKTNVMMMDIYPSLNPKIILNAVKESSTENQKIEGLILKTYGVGNAPSTPEFLKTIEEINNEMIVVDVTQCPQGMVELGLYDASIGLMDKGVITGTDMTAEAALCKLMSLLGKNLPIEEVKKQMQINQCGEQSLNAYSVDYSGAKKAEPTFLQNSQIPGEIEHKNIEKAVLLFQDVFLVNGTSNSINVDIFVGIPSIDEKTSIDCEQYTGNISKPMKKGGKTNLYLDATEQVKRFLKPGQYGPISVVSRSGSIGWRKITLSIYTRVR